MSRSPLAMLRRDLDALLLEVNHPPDKSVSRYDLESIVDRGQQIVGRWVSKEAGWKQERSAYNLKLGPFSQFSLCFDEFEFGIDPFEEDADLYRWYVIFGDHRSNSVVFAPRRFNKDQ